MEIFSEKLNKKIVVNDAAVRFRKGDDEKVLIMYNHDGMLLYKSLTMDEYNKYKKALNANPEYIKTCSARRCKRWLNPLRKDVANEIKLLKEKKVEFAEFNDIMKLLDDIHKKYIEVDEKSKE